MRSESKEQVAIKKIKSNLKFVYTYANIFSKLKTNMI